MKPGLRRIEATLDQLIEGDTPESMANESTVPHPTSLSGSKKTNKGAVQSRNKTQAIEPFPLPPHAPEGASVSVTVPVQANSVQVNSAPIAASEEILITLGTMSQSPQPISANVHPFPVQGSCSEMPALPRSKPASISSHRHAANPNLAVGLLKEIETLVRGWQNELEQIVQQIQTLYQEGPIVDGWLESYAPNGQHAASPLSASTLRHAEIDHLMEFIEQICNADQAQLLDELPRTNYRLCGLDPDGKIWSRPCPSEQVPYVGLAIARYQKLRTLFAKKQSLENRLMGLVETLTMLHGQIRD